MTFGVFASAELAATVGIALPFGVFVFAELPATVGFPLTFGVFAELAVTFGVFASAELAATVGIAVTCGVLLLLDFLRLLEFLKMQLVWNFWLILQPLCELIWPFLCTILI